MLIEREREREREREMVVEQKMAIDLAWWSNKQEVEKIVTLIERERERE